MERQREQTSKRTDLELLEAAKSGDYRAFETLVRRYHERVRRLAFGMTHNELDAQEIVQDTFLNVFKNLHSFRADAAPGSWIFRIASNSALMRLRTKRRKPLISIEDIQDNAGEGHGHGAKAIWPTGDWSRQPEEKLLNQELVQHLSKAIDKLPEKYRLVLLLRDIEGLKNEEVAEALGLTVPTVKARLHRSRLFLRTQLDRYFNTDT